MSDVNCPYCGTDQEINHDDGYGYEEDKDHEQECVKCDKTFRFVTSVMFSYTPLCDEGVMPHDWEVWEDHPTMEGCTRCDASRRIPEPKP